MISRLTFLAIAIFWVTMNILLWRAEFGSHADETPVPLELVWRKILTAPDASSLSVYQNGQRTGYCEFSTSIEQEMATLDADKPPPEGLVARAGYQVHLAGNVALGDFTNRLKFDGRIKFFSVRQWREFNLKISSHNAIIEIHSVETNQMVHVKISDANGENLERDLAFTDLQNPNTLIRAFTGNFADALLETVDFPEVKTDDVAQKIQLDARRIRVKIGTETVPVYRLETRIFDHPITADISTLGEILRVQLPGDITAKIDEWSH
jgi:hypothetical protein